MIYVTRLNHTELVLNADLIEHIEMTPDTVLSLTTGQKLVVRETADEIIARTISYRHSIVSGILPVPRETCTREARRTMIGEELHGRPGRG